MVGILAITLGIIILTATVGVIIGVCILTITLCPIFLAIIMESTQVFLIPIIHERIDLNQGVEVIA
jgi:hypothetical protein